MKNSMLDFILSTDCGMIDTIEFGEDYDKLSKTELELYDKIKNMMNEEQNELFEKFVDANIESAGMVEEIYFKEGFKAGLRLAVECLADC